MNNDKLQAVKRNVKMCAHFYIDVYFVHIFFGAFCVPFDAKHFLVFLLNH